jgi:hypothetical protein
MVSPVFGSAVPLAEKLQISPLHAGVLNTGVGATLPAGSTIVTVCVAVPVTPHSSLTVRTTV